MKNRIIYFISFNNLGVLYTSFHNFFKLLGKNFDEILVVNSDNLRIFSKKIKFYNKNTINKFPKKILFKNPLNFNELKKTVDFKKSVVINNIERKFNYYRLIYFLSRRKVPQIIISHVGNIQGLVYYYWNKNFNYLLLLFTKQLPKKIAAILTVFKIFSKIDIRFTSNKKLYKNFYKNKKKLFSKPSIYKDMILVKSKQFDQSSKNIKKNEKFITLLDFQPDYREMSESTGKLSNKKIKQHYSDAIIFLKKIEKIYNKKIIICIHPLYSLKKISKIYKDFKVVKFQTKEFIEKSYIVLFYDSSAIVDAIVLKKKIIALNADLYKGKKNMSDLWTDIIPFTTINISKQNKINKVKLINELNRKINLYDRYLKTFASNDLKEDGSKKIIKIIKKKFFSVHKSSQLSY